ncbi:hypothetical protein GQ44DRAFT_710892 [Phaeosphaeriaceae sp. PMI808]|nr:hypothetical protein GQ44DRAFT_710892 [Phaeosphaeriaceae sp. PMI808]
MFIMSCINFALTLISISLHVVLHALPFICTCSVRFVLVYILGFMDTAVPIIGPFIYVKVVFITAFGSWIFELVFSSRCWEPCIAIINSQSVEPIVDGSDFV